jgi:hypothetical protein
MSYGALFNQNVVANNDPTTYYETKITPVKDIVCHSLTVTAKEGEQFPIVIQNAQDVLGSGNDVIVLENNGVARWALGISNIETSGNNGTDLSFFSYDNTGNFLGGPMTIYRHTNTVNFAQMPTVVGVPILNGVAQSINGSGGLVAPVPPLPQGYIVATVPLNSLAKNASLVLNVAFKNNNSDGNNNSDVFFWASFGTTQPTTTPKQIGFNLYTPSNATVAWSGSTSLVQGVDYVGTETNLYVICAQSEGYPNSRIDNWSVNATVGSG